MSPEQFARFIQDDRAYWERQIAAAGVKPD
jgi:hypothetical protein